MIYIDYSIFISIFTKNDKKNNPIVGIKFNGAGGGDGWSCNAWLDYGETHNGCG